MHARRDIGWITHGYTFRTAREKDVSSWRCNHIAKLMAAFAFHLIDEHWRACCLSVYLGPNSVAD